MNELEPLPIPNAKPQRIPQKRKTPQKAKTTRLAVDVEASLLEKIKDYAYWEGFTQQEVAIQTFEAFFKNKKIPSRPERVRNRPKVGRKPKHT